MNLTSLLSPAGNPVSPADPLSVQLITNDPTGAVGVTTILPVALQPGPSSGTIGATGGQTFTDTVLFTLSIGAALQNRLWGWTFNGVAQSSAVAGSAIVHNWRFSLKGVTSGKILVLGNASATSGTGALTAGTSYYFPVYGSSTLSGPFSLLTYFSGDSQVQGIAEVALSPNGSIQHAGLALFTSVS